MELSFGQRISGLTADGAELIASADRAVISPWDRVVEAPCTQMLVQLRRDVELRFDQPGTATLHLQGLSDDGTGPHPAEITAQVVVR